MNSDHLSCCCNNCRASSSPEVYCLVCINSIKWWLLWWHITCVYTTPSIHLHTALFSLLFPPSLSISTLRLYYRDSCIHSHTHTHTRMHVHTHMHAHTCSIQEAIILKISTLNLAWLSHSLSPFSALCKGKARTGILMRIMPNPHTDLSDTFKSL